MIRKIIDFINRKKILLLALFLLGGAGFFGYKNLTAQKQEKWETSRAEKRDITRTVTASGETHAQEEATLKFQTSGELVWVGVEEGDKVEKWDAIASLDKVKLEKTLKQELIDYKNERWDYEQTTLDDYKDQALTETIRRAKEQAQFDLDRVVLDVEIADIALKYANLYTPIAGIVTSIEAPHPGTNITPATAEFVISNPETVIFTAEVDEVDIGLVKEGMEAEIVMDAYLDEVIKSRVKEVGFSSVTTSGGGTAFEVEFDLPENVDEKYRLGMNGEAEIFIEERQETIVIPFQAVQEDDEGTFVWVLEENAPVKRAVESGFTSGLDTTILSGIEEGDLVITSGFNELNKNNK